MRKLPTEPDVLAGKLCPVCGAPATWSGVELKEIEPDVREWNGIKRRYAQFEALPNFVYGCAKHPGTVRVFNLDGTVELLAAGKMQLSADEVYLIPKTIYLVPKP